MILVEPGPITRLAIRANDAAREEARINAELLAAVIAARADGLTWKEIGDAAGLTRQGAHKRWAELVERFQ